MPSGTPFCAWIEQLATDGISEGCGGNNFCPNQPVTRGQLALFLERAIRGTAAWDVDADLLDGHDSTEFVTVASQTWAATHRKYYLTQGPHSGAQALAACANGFHMASLFEILDVTDLAYDVDLGYVLAGADAGAGPPAALNGWVRTGFFADTSQFTGVANCAAWTSQSGSDYGTYVALDSGWSAATVSHVLPWEGATATCDSSLQVWCVQD